MSATLLILFAVLQTLDIYTTGRVIAQGGSERNPLLAKLDKMFGFLPAMVVVKGIMVALVVIFLADMPGLLIALDVLYVVVVVRNYRHIK